MAMQVVNRKGEREDVRFDAIHEKLVKRCPRVWTRLGSTRGTSQN